LRYLHSHGFEHGELTADNVNVEKLGGTVFQAKMIYYGGVSNLFKDSQSAFTSDQSLGKNLQELSFSPERLKEISVSPHGQMLFDYFDLGCLLLDLTVG